jgi:lipoyl(octanoyl) transferase
MSSCEVRFLNKITFAQALHEQSAALDTLYCGKAAAVLLGFECFKPVITLGRRGRAEQDILRAAFEILTVDRGGQATLHNPGQLVIFPLMSVRRCGVRAWIEGLASVTQKCLRTHAIESHWDSTNPGLYTANGKIMACGVRIHRGISTHGVSINIKNDLSEFSVIRSCGVQDAPLDRVGEQVQISEFFEQWAEIFKTHFDHATGS